MSEVTSILGPRELHRLLAALRLPAVHSTEQEGRREVEVYDAFLVSVCDGSKPGRFPCELCRVVAQGEAEAMVWESCQGRWRRVSVLDLCCALAKEALR